MVIFRKGALLYLTSGKSIERCLFLVKPCFIKRNMMKHLRQSESVQNMLVGNSFEKFLERIFLLQLTMPFCNHGNEKWKPQIGLIYVSGFFLVLFTEESTKGEAIENPSLLTSTSRFRQWRASINIKSISLPC